MNRTDLLQLVAHGENSRVEFKRDDVRPERLASELAALLNHEGGWLLLGVEDGGAVSGLTRPAERAEEWLMQLARDHVRPPVAPTWETVELDSGFLVGVVAVPANAPDKPYKSKQGSSWVTKVRVGTTARDATREEEQRLYQQSGGLRYGLKPVLGTDVGSLDARRIHDYLSRVLGDTDTPAQSSEQWRRLLLNLELLTETSAGTFATVDGMLLFGRNNRRFMPQCGVRAVCYAGTDLAYATRADEEIKGALVPLGSSDGSLLETGLIERTLDFMRRNTEPSAHLQGGRRIDRSTYPDDVIRELVVNALVHRDYSITGTDVMLSIFSDHLEIQSPGTLPNSISVERLVAGSRYARNQTLVNVMRDYGYVDGRGMGIRLKVVPGMRAHNGTVPDFLEEQDQFTVRLWK